MPYNFGMSIISPIPSHLDRLTSLLARKRSRIADLLRRMTCGGTAGGHKAGLLGKFLGFVDQVAEERDEEAKLIDRIEAMERRHHFCRDHNQLECGDAEYRREDDEEPISVYDSKEKQKERKGLWRFFPVWLQVSARDNC